jgi:hypothetical protein
MVEDVAAAMDIARTNLLAITKKIIQDRSDKARSERPYLKKFNLSTPTLMLIRNSRHRAKGRRTHIEEVVVSIHKGHEGDDNQTDTNTGGKKAIGPGL